MTSVAVAAVVVAEFVADPAVAEPTVAAENMGRVPVPFDWELVYLALAMNAVAAEVGSAVRAVGIVASAVDAVG